MQKKLFLSFLVLISGIFFGVYAETVEVEALEAFSTANPPSAINVKLLNELELNNNLKNPGSIELPGN